MATAIGAALFERVRSGLGQRVVVSGLHGAAQVLPSTRFEQEQRVDLGTRLSAARRTIASINARTVSGSSSARCSKRSTCGRWR